MLVRSPVVQLEEACGRGLAEELHGILGGFAERLGVEELWFVQLRGASTLVMLWRPGALSIGWRTARLRAVPTSSHLGQLMAAPRWEPAADRPAVVLWVPRGRTTRFRLESLCALPQVLRDRAADGRIQGCVFRHLRRALEVELRLAPEAL